MGLRPASDADEERPSSAVDVEVLIVGAGISGIGAGIELLTRGRSSFVILEAGDRLGGTWRENTYPGVAVDIPSSSYCFSFETDYPWSRAFATGAEIQEYIEHCAKKFGVDRHIRSRSRVLRSRFDPALDRWCTQLASGEQLTSRYLISATGLFSQPKLPEIPGLERFAGKAMHSARWDHDHELADQRVAIIGTGASAIQIVPEIAPRVAHLSVFQRTPIWVGPRPDYPLRPNSALHPRRLAPLRGALRLQSESSLELLTFAIVNYKRLPWLVGLVQRCVRIWMRRQLHDPQLAARLIPNYGLGCKRPATSNHYLSTFNRDNVSLVTDRIQEICAEGLVTLDGVMHPADTLVLATGFLTTERGNAPAFEVFGREGVELGEYWEDHRLQAYAGVSVPSYPNFFLTAGPYSGGFNWFSMLQAHLEHIMRCLEAATARGVTRIEVKARAHELYMQDMWRRADGTIFKDRSCQTANSYYLDRHGDAALPLPRTPWWRILREYKVGTRDYRFGLPGSLQGPKS